MAQDQRKAELVAELALARSRIAAQTGGLRRDLDFPGRAKKAFQRSPLPWLTGAAVFGLVVAALPRRTKKVPVAKVKLKDDTVEKAGKAGLLLGAMKIAFDLARPVLLRWATQRATDYFHTAQTRPPYPR